MRPKDNVYVTAECYEGPAVVEQVYAKDDAVVVRRSNEPLNAIPRLRRPGGVFVVSLAACRLIAPPAEPTRHPLPRASIRQRIVGLAGPKKVGKSTTADALRSAFLRRGVTAEIRSFAGPLYQAISMLTGIPESVLRDQTIKDRPLTAVETSNPCLIGKTSRFLLEWLGQGARTAIGVDHWVHRAFTNLPDVDVIIFDDARHDPEFEATTINFELARAGCTYPCNHPSAMPPDPKYINRTVKLDDYAPMEVGEILCALVVGAASPVAAEAS